MNGIDSEIEQSYRDAFKDREVVKFRRVIGDAGNVQTVSAEVRAVVTGHGPDASTISRQGFKPTGLGTVTQNDRQVLVLFNDLKAKGFPVPLRKDDQVIAGDDTLTITEVDAHTRAPAGCYVLIATGL